MDLIETLCSLNGYWKYSGGKYLAKLTSGKVSDTYCNCGVLTCRPVKMRRSCADLIYKMVHSAGLPNNVGADFPWEDDHLRDWVKRNNFYVCGPAMGGITLAYEVARQLDGTAIFTEPVYELGKEAFAGGGWSSSQITCNNLVDNKAQKHYVQKSGQQLKRFEIPEGATVLFVEDVITTGKSTREMIYAIATLKASPKVNVLPYVLCLVNRSGHDDIWTLTRDDGSKMPMNVAGYCWHKNFKIISLADVQARTWDTIDDATEELLSDPGNRSKLEKHKQGNEIVLDAVRPKEHWDLLTGGDS